VSTREELVDQVCDWGSSGGRFIYQKTTDGRWFTYCPLCRMRLGFDGQVGQMGEARYNHLLEHSDEDLKQHIVLNLMRGTGGEEARAC
jgi:hypothetical protein